MNFKDLFRLNTKVINLGGYLKYFKYYVFNHHVISDISSKDDLISSKTSNRCYICALGPSLKEVDFNALDGDSIVVNRFYKHGLSLESFVPTYYLMIDAQFASDANKKDFYDALKAYENKKTRFILNSKLASVKEIHELKNNISYVSCCKGLFNSSRTYELGKVMPAFGNVACTAVAIAISLGYDEIYLLGCDFNSFASRKAVHCYAEANEERQISLSYELYCYSLVAEMHEQLYAFAQKKGVKIINTTKGSLIDAYPYEIDDNLYKK